MYIHTISRETTLLPNQFVRIYVYTHTRFLHPHTQSTGGSPTHRHVPQLQGAAARGHGQDRGDHLEAPPHAALRRGGPLLRLAPRGVGHQAPAALGEAGEFEFSSRLVYTKGSH